MRSYKDCLVEYLEEIEFKKLNSAWYTYFSEVMNTPENFQILTGFPSLKSTEDLKYYADLIPSNYLYYTYRLFQKSKRSDTYKDLIKCLMKGELDKVRQISKESSFHWKSCSQSLNFYKNNNYKNFTDAYEECLEKSDLNLADLVQQKRLNEMHLHFIDEFFNEENYFLDRPDYDIKDAQQSSKIFINFDSSTYKEEFQTSWSENVNKQENNLFESGSVDLSELNSYFSQADVKVYGKLSGLNKSACCEGRWMSSELIKLLLEDNTNQVKEMITYPKRKKMLEQLHRRFTTFYTITDFDLTIEIKKTVSESQLHQLRTKQFSMFPFHFSESVKHHKWIDCNDEGDLVIRMKKTDTQPTLIGAELQFTKERHF